jgi:hypothetical protein
MSAKHRVGQMSVGQMVFDQKTWNKIKDVFYFILFLFFVRCNIFDFDGQKIANVALLLF